MEGIRLNKKVIVWKSTFKRLSKLPNPIIDFNGSDWLYILEKQNYRCANCYEIKELELDHIIPISKGGNHTRDNIQGLCPECNSRKGNKYIAKVNIAEKINNYLNEGFNYKEIALKIAPLLALR